jgi:hypothetical protein
MGLKRPRAASGSRPATIAPLVDRASRPNSALVVTPLDRRGGGPDRRALLGPPNGIERRVGIRRANDVGKPACPWCGGGSSSVYRSKGAGLDDRYRRRRRCDDCGRTWPTAESLDIARFRRELAKARVDPSELGLDQDDRG